MNHFMNGIKRPIKMLLFSNNLGSALGDTLGGAGIGAAADGAVGAAVPGAVFDRGQYCRDTQVYCYFVVAVNHTRTGQFSVDVPTFATLLNFLSVRRSYRLRRHIG